MLLIGEVKLGTGNDVIQMPAKHTIIAPVHVRAFQLLIYVSQHLFWSASHIFANGIGLLPSFSAQEFAKPATEAVLDYDVNWFLLALLFDSAFVPFAF